MQMQKDTKAYAKTNMLSSQKDRWKDNRNIKIMTHRQSERHEESEIAAGNGDSEFQGCLKIDFPSCNTNDSV